MSRLTPDTIAGYLGLHALAAALGLAIVAGIALLMSPITDTPTPSPTVTVTAPPATVKVTVPGPTRTVTVTRASRSEVRIPPPVAPSPVRRVGAALDLRHARLWDRIAACESGRNWRANTGLFDGGLQFLPSTWRSWGGTDFAPYAYMATRAEQITVANRSTRSRVGEPWLAPWPVCGRRAAAALGYKFP